MIAVGDWSELESFLLSNRSRVPGAKDIWRVIQFAIAEPAELHLPGWVCRKNGRGNRTDGKYQHHLPICCRSISY